MVNTSYTIIKLLLNHLIMVTQQRLRIVTQPLIVVVVDIMDINGNG